jgi:TetR/AcrR family transcriptional regulator, regulator of cefoperazone and chloramphenicol sensitivity
VTTWRQRQAAETRRQIVRAARRLFVASGYAGTTVEAIAAEAGVAVATVYKAFGTKAAIARELNDLIDEEADTVGLAAQIEAETEPARLIGLAVAQLRAQHERCGDIITAIRSGAAADATLAEVWDEGTRRYDDGMRKLAGKLKACGALRSGLTTAHAAGLLSVLCSTEAFTGLTARHGWTASQWETRTASALRQLLLWETRAHRNTHPPTPDNASTQRQQAANR